MMVDYSYLRPKKAENLKSRHASEFVRRAPLPPLSYKNATILPLRTVNEGEGRFSAYGGAVDADGAFIPASRVRHPELGAVGSPTALAYSSPEYRDEKVVYCGYFWKHWGHLLVDYTARLWYFLQNDPTVDKYIFFFDMGRELEIDKNYREFFELLGIWDKLEFINTPVRYREVLIPGSGFERSAPDGGNYYLEEFKEIFMRVAQNIRPQKDWPTARKLFFTRSQMKNIHQIDFGLEMLDHYFSKNGYLVIAPETISLSQMIYLIQNAEEVAAVSGTLPHNMLFAKDGQKLVILERNVVNNPCQPYINRLKDLQVTYIDANIPLYSVHISGGPFILAYTDLFDAYTRQCGYLPPDEKYRTPKYFKHLLVGYMKAYEKRFHYQWFFHPWTLSAIDYLYEGYQAGYSYYQAYLTGQRPFLLRHYFMPSYWLPMARWITASIKRRMKLLLHIN